tara:strand:- start:2022 stop:2156 length:135 start_codon:yes stop_codon:yes gene_type:complete
MLGTKITLFKKVMLGNLFLAKKYLLLVAKYPYALPQIKNNLKSS